MFPIACFRNCTQAFIEVAGCKFQARRTGIVRRDLVHAAQLERIDAELVGCFVHMNFMREMHLAGRIAAHCTGSRMVRIRTACFHVDVLDFVRERCTDQRQRIGSDSGSSVSTAIEDMLASLGKQLAFLRERRLDLKGNRMSRTGAHEDFITLQDALDRMTCHLGKLCRAEFVCEHIELAAETAADHRLDDSDLRLRNPKAPCDPVAADICALSRSPDRPFVVLVLGNCPMRLNGCVDHFLRLVIVAVREICFLECLVDIPCIHDREDRQVLGIRIMNRFCIRLHRIERIEDDRQRLIFHLDKRSSFRRSFFCRCADRSNFIADHAHLAAAERFLISKFLERFRVSEVVSFREILSGQNAFDSRNLQSFREVDGLDQRMCIRAVDQLAVIHARQFDVVGIDGFSGYFCFGIDADIGIALAGQLIVFRLLVYGLNVLVIIMLLHDLPPS